MMQNEGGGGVRSGYISYGFKGRGAGYDKSYPMVNLKS